MATTPRSSTSSRPTADRSKPGTSNAELRERREPQPNVLTHTEFASRDPKATRDFLRTAFGWEFETMPGPTGDYHMFRQENNTGGGVRALAKAEAPAAIPYVEVEDLGEAERTAKKAGAKVLQPRTDMGEGATIVLQAPGGPLIGLWGPNKAGRGSSTEEE
jgi:predicted enzyme related to lactoylglutathione lyase